MANKILPKDNKLPHSHREVSSIMKDIGMEYKTYDACPNDHILYYGENANLQQCPVCHTNRYRQDQVSKKVPYKVLRHIPLKPRFERMFKCKELAKYMDYHAQGRSQDGVMRMVADSKYWKDIEEKWPHLRNEPRNARISLAMDGVNPFGDLRTTYSIWPVLIINNNLPPWMAMKKEHAMLTLIIPGTRTYECNALLNFI